MERNKIIEEAIGTVFQGAIAFAIVASLGNCFNKELNKTAQVTDTAPNQLAESEKDR